MNTFGSGGEPVIMATVRRFVEAFQESGVKQDMIKPCWGMAEACVFLTGFEPASSVTVAENSLGVGGQVQVCDQSSGSKEVVSNGKPSFHSTVAVVHPDTLELLSECQVTRGVSFHPDLVHRWVSSGLLVQTWQTVTIIFLKSPKLLLGHVSLGLMTLQPT